MTETFYNADGQISRISSPTGVINYEYDAVTGQVSRTWTGIDAANPVTDIRNTYDAFGRLETVETYAREGALLGNPEIARYIYDVIGNLDKIHHANGVITDYDYDILNRLKEVTHYAPDATPDDLTDNAVLQKFLYDYHANGHKSGETATDKDGNTNTWTWDYDALGRLVSERHDNHDDTLDYTTDYVFDLVGNRLEKRTDQNNDGTIDERIVSQYDQNDRLLNELKILNGTASQRTDYTYNVTEQIEKTVTDLLNSRIESKTHMEYNDAGRMSKITIETYVDGQLSKVITQEYEYDASGIKVKQTESIDADADGTIDSTKVTEYLNDVQNHTGYSQVLEERTSENGGPVKITTYTIGHDVLSQYNAEQGYLSLLTDGHGSTRAVADATAQILQQYNYDAYGNALGFNAAEAMTNLLYSGEQFNPVSGLQYLRARWYNPQSGRFNRLDPYAGNQESPLSFHKYAYGHGNPVSFVDPSGNSILAAVIFAIIGAGIGGYFAYNYAQQIQASPLQTGMYMVGGMIFGGALGVVGGMFFNATAGLATKAIAVSSSATSVGGAALGAAGSASTAGYTVASMAAALGAGNGFYVFTKKYPNADFSKTDTKIKLLGYMYAGSLMNLGGSTIGSGVYAAMRAPGMLSSVISGATSGFSTSLAADGFYNDFQSSGLTYFGGAVLGGAAGLINVSALPVNSPTAGHIISSGMAEYISNYGSHRNVFGAEMPVILTPEQFQALQNWESGIR